MLLVAIFNWYHIPHTNKRNTHMLYNCKDIDGFLEVTSLWVHAIHQNLCRTQWPCVGNNIDSRDNLQYLFTVM